MHEFNLKKKFNRKTLSSQSACLYFYNKICVHYYYLPRGTCDPLELLKLWELDSGLASLRSIVFADGFVGEKRSSLIMMMTALKH